MRKLLAIFTSVAMFGIGPCAVDSWKLAFGPVVNGETVYGGVELEFNNGLDLIIPMVSLGDNLGN